MTTNVELFAPPRVTSERRPDGTVLLSSEEPLGEVEPSMVSAFRSRAERDPDRRLAAQRGEDGSWVELSYGEARERADSLGQALLEQGLGPEHPLLVLSGNSIDHLVATLACYTARVPVIPISVAYSLASRDHARIREIVELCRPKMVFAEDARAFGAALDAVGDVRALVSRNHGERPGALVMSDLATDRPGGAIEQAAARVTPDTVAKVLFTSGSTGAPKGVINTHRMLCSNQQMLAQIWPFLREEPPVLVDWLPWSHTFGGNHNVGLVLTHGGTLYIDDGKPAPGLFERTLAALREIQPTVYFNVPAGYAQLVPQLEADPGFAESFFSRMRFLFYAAAALPEDLWDRLRALASRFAEREVPITSSWGSTETAPAATSAHFSFASCGCIGVPLPGVALKLIPDGDRFEIRVAGPNVTPGYLDNPEATSRAFDEDGYYRSGDAVRFVDIDRPEHGLRFDGRVSEDFKLTSGMLISPRRSPSSTPGPGPRLGSNGFCSSPSPPSWTRARSPTRVTSTSARSSSGALATSIDSSPNRRRGRSSSRGLESPSAKPGRGDV